MHPLLILAIGIAIVLGMIIFLRINAFIALITAALTVSFLAPGPLAEKVSRVAESFGENAGKIGIVIALAAVIGQAMMASGAADRIVNAFLNLLGEKRASWALMGSGFVLAVPVFFDTVFYLLVPLARSLFRRTRRNYLLYVCAIGAGGAITHTLVPPTPGPLLMAANLNISVGMMILVGALVAAPAAVVGIVFATFMDRRMPIVPSDIDEDTGGAEAETEPVLPPLWEALLPVVLPVLMISTDTVAKTMADREIKPGAWHSMRELTQVFGNPNFALLVSMAIALWTWYRLRRPAIKEFSGSVETALMSGGLIILITAAGGAFGAMLKAAEIGDTIEGMFSGSGSAGLALMFLGFGLAAVLKVAQGSSTTAMITASAMIAAMEFSPEQLGYNPVYLATSIGAGSLVGSWMNDSGFWIFARMSGLTETEALKSWTPMLIVLGGVSFGVTLLLSQVLPLL